MATDRSPLGWRTRIAVLWGAVAAMLAAALIVLYQYGVIVTQINQAYLDSELQQSEFDAIDEQWWIADILTRTSTLLLTTAVLLIVLTLATQTRGWQLRRERARAQRSDPLAH